MFDDEDKLKSVFSLNMRNLMSKSGTSEVAISNEAGISQSAINRIKNGSVCPTLFQAIKITSFFKVDLTDLLKEEGKNEKPHNEYYIPVINTTDFIKKGNKNINGFYKTDETMEGSVGFKYDNAFSCNILNKETVIILKKLPKHKILTNGTTLLYLERNVLKIGNYQDDSIRPIDNLVQAISPNKINILGKVVKIETKYIKDKSMIERIKHAIGTKRLVELLDTTLSFSF